MQSSTQVTPQATRQNFWQHIQLPHVPRETFIKIAKIAGITLLFLGGIAALVAAGIFTIHFLAIPLFFCLIGSYLGFSTGAVMLDTSSRTPREQPRSDTLPLVADPNAVQLVPTSTASPSQSTNLAELPHEISLSKKETNNLWDSYLKALGITDVKGQFFNDFERDLMIIMNGKVICKMKESPDLKEKEEAFQQLIQAFGFPYDLWEAAAEKKPSVVHALMLLNQAAYTRPFLAGSLALDQYDYHGFASCPDPNSCESAKTPIIVKIDDNEIQFHTEQLYTRVAKIYPINLAHKTDIFYDMFVTVTINRNTAEITPDIRFVRHKETTLPKAKKYDGKLFTSEQALEAYRTKQTQVG